MATTKDKLIIRAEFEAHALNDEGRAQLDQIRDAFGSLLDEIEKRVPAGRERALVTTKLQEAAMWAARGLAAKPETRG